MAGDGHVDERRLRADLAFGADMHETTRLCTRAPMIFAMMYHSDSNWCSKKCIDVGCETGILGISALKCGLQHTLLKNYDENAIAARGENASTKGIDRFKIDYRCADFKLGLLGRESDLIFVIILADLLMENSNGLTSSVKPGEILCLRVIFIDKMLDMRTAFEKSFDVLHEDIQFFLISCYPKKA